MSIKNPLLEGYSSQKKSSLLASSSSCLKSSLLKRSNDVTDDPLIKSSKSLRPSVLSSPSVLLAAKPLTSLGSLKSTCTSTGQKKSLSSSLIKTSISLSSPVSDLRSKNVNDSVTKTKKSTEVYSKDCESGEVKDFSEISPFLEDDNIISIPLSVDDNIINNCFTTISKATIKLSEEQVLKQDFINLAACSLITVPKLDNKDDSVRIKLISLAEKIIALDPEFILKMALFTRRILNIRVTANFLVAFAAFKKPCRKYIKKYYQQTVMLPSDWIDVAELYTSLGDKNIGFSALPVCLRKAMAKKFPKFDTYQIGKYNKKPKKKASKGNAEESENEDDETKLYERQHFTLKQLIRKIHICDPPDSVMPILGKKYPETQEQFYRSRLSGMWDESQAGKRMKVPTPYTWETQLAAKGNNADTWKELILSRKLPYMAMLRNLRNIIQSGVKDNIHKIVQRKLSSPEDVKRSKQFPFRFLSAYAVLDSLDAQPGKTISWSTTPDFEQEKIIDSYKVCLDKAVQLAAINNVKPIKGSLLLMFDCSDLMDEQCSAKGFGMTRTIREVAGLMTLMCMFSSEHCDVVYYNGSGTVRGEKIETGGEILKFLSSFVSGSKEANTELLSQDGVHMSVSDCWAEITNRERHYDTIIQIAPTCSNFSAYRNVYREKVNSEVLAVEINLKSKTTQLVENFYAHRNDVSLHGFSDQMLQYISERGSGELLSNVESIDKKFNLQPLPKPMAQNYVSPLAKQVKSRVVRVFVSSTFLDLKDEREQLMNEIFRVLNSRVEDKNFTIQDVDLRWGVTKEEASSNKVILRCLEEVSRCDYFLCIIGNRYGTTFDSYPKSPNTEFRWLENEKPGLSMTQLEVTHALFHADRSKLPLKNIMFLIKQDSSGQPFPERRVTQLIGLVKGQINMEGQTRISEYDNYSTPDQWFYRKALDILEGVVVKDILHDNRKDFTDDEMHKSYVEQQANLFVGREKLVSSLVAAVQKEQTLMVTGLVGTGKSALLAKALTMFNEESRINDFYHVVKLNSSSKDVNVLLNRLCFHLSKILNEELEEHFEPISTLWSQMAKCETPFKIVIDGCDELLQSHDVFSWLPDKISKCITLIFTTSLSGQWHSYLNKKYSTLNTFNVPKLSSNEKVQVTKEMLAAYGKKLEEKGFNSQLSLLLSKREANNPLYIDLCINQLRLNAIFENLTECIQELPQTTEELYVKILQFTVQQVHPVADLLLAYLYCSKNGISESDMLHFLHLKPLALSNLLYHLKLFIRVDQDTGMMSLANQFARKVIQRQCFSDEKLAETHKELAGKYARNFLGPPCYFSVRKDAFQSVLYHYMEAGEWDAVCQYLKDLNFVRQMIYLDLIPDLVSIFNIDVAKLKGVAKASYKNAMNRDGVKHLQQFLVNNKATLSQEPYLFEQRLLLSTDYFSDIIEDNNGNIIFNKFIGSFKSLKEATQTYKCNVKEHYSIAVTCLAASEVTDTVLVGFHDSKFQAVNSADSTILQTYRGHNGPVTCCGFLTSSRFISAGSDGSLRLWSLLDSVCLAKIEPHIYQVQDIHVNEITKCIVSAGMDRRVAVWHNDVIFDTIEFSNPMNCIRFIENGKKFVAGSWTGEVYAYDLVQKVKITVKKSGKVHQSSIRALTSGKKHFASLDVTGILSVWDQMTLDVLQSVRLNNITTISYDFNDHLMYGLSNGIINVTAGFGEMTKVTIPELGAVTALFSASDSGLYIGFYSGAVVKVQPNHKTYQVSVHKGKVNLISSFKISQSGRETEYVTSCSDDGTVHVHTLSGSNVLEKALTPHIGKVLALCPGTSDVLFTGGYDCAITAMKFEKGAGEQSEYLTVQEVKLYGHQAPVSTLLTLKEGERLISGSHDGSVKLWNKLGKCVFTAGSAHQDWVTCSAAADNSSQFFVTGSNDNIVVLWKLENSRIFPTSKLMGHTSPVTCVSVLGSEKNPTQMIIGGAQDGTLVLWNKDGKFVSATRPGERGVNACTFVPGSSSNPTAYVGTVDGEVKCMKPAKLDIIASFTHHTAHVKSVQGMSGNRIVSISADNTLQCWSWDSGEATTNKLQSIADIKYGVELQGPEKIAMYRIGVVDKTGSVACWSLRGDVLSFVSESEGLKKTKPFALMPPTVAHTQGTSLYVPENPQGVLLCLTSQNYIVEIVSGKNYQANYQVMFMVRSIKFPDEVYMKEQLSEARIVTYADLNDEDILIVGTSSNMMHVWNLKTKKRMPSSSSFSTTKRGEINQQYQYPTSAAYYLGKNIMGLVTGYIKVPHKKRSEEVYERVFNSAVTAMECFTNEEGDLIIFAGSKDGVIKVLTDNLKVIGMYHTNGPVTKLRILRSPGHRGGTSDKVHLVAGDKCGCVHFLKWLPPKRYPD